MGSLITFSHSGKFSKTDMFLEKMLEGIGLGVLDKYGRKGIEILKEATPKDTGKTAESWTYSIEKEGSSLILAWDNTNLNDGFRVAILLQYGHATKNGGFVEGIDFINPSMKPLFQELADEAWRELIRK